MQAAIDGLLAPLYTVEGKKNMSLVSAGYFSMGIDEGWEGCGKGVNGTQHAADGTSKLVVVLVLLLLLPLLTLLLRLLLALLAGTPVINTARFPDTKTLVDYGHSKGLKVGWYENGCACGERKALPINYAGDVKSLHALGFDGVKLDGCGAQRNMTLYAQLMKATGKSYFIENCHWGKVRSPLPLVLVLSLELLAMLVLE